MQTPVLKNTIHSSSIASWWWFVAVNNLLFRVVSFNFILSNWKMVSGFVGGSGWEGPTWSTFSLVFDFVPVSSPVDVLRANNFNGSKWSMLWSSWESSSSLHFFLSSISEFIDSEGGKWVLSVEFSDGLEVVFKNQQSVVVLVAVAVSDSVCVKEFSKLSFDAWRWSWWKADEGNSWDSNKCYDRNCLGILKN